MHPDEPRTPEIAPVHKPPYTVQLPVSGTKPAINRVDRERHELFLKGMASALHILISRFSEVGGVPDLFNERRTPLSKDARVSTSIVWTLKHDDMPLPSVSCLNDFLWQIVVSLQINIAQITVAYVILERILCKHIEMRTLVQPFAIRPFFIGCCVVAIKLTEDTVSSMSTLAECLNEYYPEVTATQLYNYECGILDALDWHVPIDRDEYQAYYTHLVREAQRNAQVNAASQGVPHTVVPQLIANNDAITASYPM